MGIYIYKERDKNVFKTTRSFKDIFIYQMSLKQHGDLKTFLSIKCPASLRWALSWGNTGDIYNIYNIYIHMMITTT